MNHSITNVTDLSSINDIERTLKALALADAILMPDWEYRYFSFNSNWDGNKKEMMGSMRDGSGGEYFISLTHEGVAGKVLYDNALLDASQALLAVPDRFASFKIEPAFSIDRASFFFWRAAQDIVWSASPPCLEEYPLLNFLKNSVYAYHSWAEEYYEREIDVDVLKEIFASVSITADQLLILNPEIKLEDIEGDLQEILS